eukprot:TRINITY_DN78908_c0_g2_i1.p1 TRINITY_DN78908_c0_g2~~TRINITY_DN78908_c0_g2_i1.p1  ORF type:complete len:109 (-),score=11.66 TRINITY_DN78908_c0_g2_i1:503-829(-)
MDTVATATLALRGTDPSVLNVTSSDVPVAGVDSSSPGTLLLSEAIAALKKRVGDSLTDYIVKFEGGGGGTTDDAGIYDIDADQGEDEEESDIVQKAKGKRKGKAAKTR